MKVSKGVDKVMIHGNTLVQSVFDRENPIITKCALTVTAAITVTHHPLTPHFFSQILTQTNACARTTVVAYAPLNINSI